MTPDILLSLTGMAFAASWTPGPNNSMLASPGATYGVRATIPHALGVSLGFPVMIFLVGLGFGEIFRQSPALQQIMRYAGAAMLIWIAWKIATAEPPGKSEKTTRPLRFLEAAAFQWVNPKGWLAATAITTQFVTADRQIQTALIVAGVFIFGGLSSTLAWAGFGRVIGSFLRTPFRLKVFNISMALMLIGFLGLILTTA